MNSVLLALFSFILSVSGCSRFTPLNDSEVKKESAQANKFFDDYFELMVARYPTSQTYYGRRTNYGLLDNETEEYDEENYKITRETLAKLKEFNFAALDEETKLSYRILKYQLEEGIEGYRWRYHGYTLNQMFGYYSELPSFMINMHEISSVDDATAYISRLREMGRVFAEKMVILKKKEKLGIVPPHFVFSKVIDDSQNIIRGKPFKGEGESPLYQDFKSKINRLQIHGSKKGQLLKEAESALKGFVGPAYQGLISYVEHLSQKHKSNRGVWALPDGQEYYNFKLRSSTTTDLRAEEIHELGLSEVRRIQAEMQKIILQIGFEGDLKAFFKHLRSDKFVYPSTKAGRKSYLKEVNRVVDEMRGALPRLFNTFPKAELMVRPVEAYREKSAGTAFYSGPSLEGNRPGIYYVNLYKMEDNPKYELEALAYHEAIPGHHMQIAIANELDHLPKFRRSGGFTAYVEGWGLYAEMIPKEIGFYQDPYSDFGRLALEIWRAVRLVVDTGIHSKKWTREQAIQYMRENAPVPEIASIKEIERYFVMPGQATAYKIGMLKILSLREKARKELGERFDIRKYHDVVLRSGAIPLEILEERVENWITQIKETR